MTADKHTHSIHIDAPVEKVFGYVADPAHFVAVMPGRNQATLGAVNRTPDGGVKTFEVKYRELGLHLTAEFTREEQVTNERMVDHSSLGVLFIYSFEPDDTGTTLTLSWDATKLMKMVDTLSFHSSDKELESALSKIKQEIEAMP